MRWKYLIIPVVVFFVVGVFFLLGPFGTPMGSSVVDLSDLNAPSVQKSTGFIRSLTCDYTTKTLEFELLAPQHLTISQLFVSVNSKQAEMDCDVNELAKDQIASCTISGVYIVAPDAQHIVKNKLVVAGEELLFSC